MPPPDGSRRDRRAPDRPAGPCHRRAGPVRPPWRARRGRRARRRPARLLAVLRPLRRRAVLRRRRPPPDVGLRHQPPGLPLLAAGLDALAPGSLVVLRLPAVLATAGTALLAGLIARELGGRTRAQTT